MSIEIPEMYWGMFVGLLADRLKKEYPNVDYLSANIRAYAEEFKPWLTGEADVVVRCPACLGPTTTQAVRPENVSTGLTHFCPACLYWFAPTKECIEKCK